MPAGIYRKFLLALFLLLMLPVISYAQVSKIVFTTEPQTVKPGEISGTITVQLHDSAGSSYKATETVDVEFLSSSASGEFLSPSSENAVIKISDTEIPRRGHLPSLLKLLAGLVVKSGMLIKSLRFQILHLLLLQQRPQLKNLPPPTLLLPIKVPHLLGCLLLTTALFP